MTVHDLAIVGSGLAGSLLALIGRRLGRSVLLLEKSAHPRFVIGESSTPLSNLLLEEIAARWDQPWLASFSKWGPWRREHPDVAVGLKRGFTFYRHPWDRPFEGLSDRSDQLLVAASPRDEVADTHWYRPELDHALVRKAEEAGVRYVDRVTLTAAEELPDRMVLSGTHDGAPCRFEARLVLDATGPRGFLHRALSLPEVPFRRHAPTQTLFSHFRGVRRLETMEPFDRFPSPPFPPDDAAVHHVFPGGWIWVLRFGNGITSAGVTCVDPLAGSLGLAEGAAAWERVLSHLPTVGEQFSEAEAVAPFFHVPRLPFRTGASAGDRWALLPYAAAFVDPLLSAGFPLTLLGIVRLAEAIETEWESPRLPGLLRAHAAQTLREVDAAEGLVAALYSAFEDFPLFSRLSLLYFAAASFSETARRLRRAERARGFLLCDEPAFATELEAIGEAARSLPPSGPLREARRAEVMDRVLRAIEPWDVAGLGRTDRHGWYPVEADDLRAARARLGAGAEEIQELLARCW